jgi:transposase
MRGWDVKSEALFSYVNCEARVPKDHPLRPIRRIVDEALGALSAEFEQLYAKFGRPPIPPERLLRALLLQAFYSVRSELQLMEQLDYNLLFRWFVGLSMDAEVWDETVFTKNRERLIEGDIARKFMAAVLSQGAVKALLSDDHFSVDGTLLEAWASMKSFPPKDGSGQPPAAGRNGERDFGGEKRSNETHASTTVPMLGCTARACPCEGRGAGPTGQARLSGACCDGEPARSGGRHASELGHRHGRTPGRAGDGGGPSRQSSDHARG